jgi:hypothetical protein
VLLPRCLTGTAADILLFDDALGRRRPVGRQLVLGSGEATKPLTQISQSTPYRRLAAKARGEHASP